MALNETSSEAVSDFAAAARMSSWLRRVSARRGLTDPVVNIPPQGGRRGLEQLQGCEPDCNPLASAGEADEYPVSSAGKRSGGLFTRRQWQYRTSECRPRRDAAGRVARTARPHRPEEGLRPGSMRRVHGALRRQA